MKHFSGAGINMSKLIEALSGFLRKKEATTWKGIRIHHCPPPLFWMRKHRIRKTRKKTKSK